MKGSVKKRCKCPPAYSKSGKRLACKKKHGSWSYVVDLGRVDGRRQQEKRGGFSTEDEAQKALADALKAINDGTNAHDGRRTVASWLNEWIELKVAGGLRPTTERSYRQHIRDHLRPQLGHLRLRDLRPTHIAAMLRKVEAGPVSVRRVHGTLRSALASALKMQLVAFNAAVNVELPAVRRPKVRPWEPAELGQFLDSIAGDRLAPLFEMIANTGLRRGEACGLRWSDVDLVHGVLTVRQQLVQVADPDPCPSCARVHRGHEFGPPKTSSGEARVVELDGGTTGVLLAHRLTQDAERTTWDAAYVDHDLVFAREDGNPLPLDHVTKRFRELAVAAGLRPVRLHDLRHGAASLMLAAGIDVALVSKRLGHSSISITADTYQHLLEGIGREAAERAAALVPRNRRDHSVTTSPETAVAPDLLSEDIRRSEATAEGAPPGTRTPNPLVKRRL